MLIGRQKPRGFGHCPWEDLPESIEQRRSRYWVEVAHCSGEKCGNMKRQDESGLWGPAVYPVCFWSLGQGDAEINSAAGGKGRPGGEGKNRGGSQAEFAGPPQELPPLKLVQESKAATTTAPCPSVDGDVVCPAIRTASCWTELLILSSYQHFLSGYHVPFTS